MSSGKPSSILLTASSRSICAGVSLTSVQARLSLTWSSMRAPMMGMTGWGCCRSQARVTSIRLPRSARLAFLARPLSRWAAIPSGRHPPRHNELGDEHLHGVATLVARLASDGCDAPVWTRPRRPELEDLALDLKHVARSRRVGPGDFTAGPDEPAGDGQAALHEQPHGDRRRVPAARHEPFKERRLRGLRVEVERLGVELPGERPDLHLIDLVRAAHKPLPDPQVV